MAPRPKNLCACGCTHHVTREIELGHMKGRRSAILAANIISQNQFLSHSHKRASKLQLLSSRRSRKQEHIGRPALSRQGKASRPDTLSSGDEYNNLPASEAGPSGVSIDPDELSARRSPTPVIEDLPRLRSSPMPLLPDAYGHDQYGLSTQRRSHRIAERVEQIGRVRWGTNHVQFIEREEREEREEDDEEASFAGDMEDDDGMGDESDELEDEDIPVAEPGQEGISVWDLLGEGFFKEAADLGKYILTDHLSDFSDLFFRRETS